MKSQSEAPAPDVSPEEIQRRIDEYRWLGFQSKGEAQVVYKTSDHPCPWPGCAARIAGINFQLKKMEDTELCERLLAAWWQGPGLVGRCPDCKRHVLYGLGGKTAVSDPQSFPSALLPEDWHAKAHLVRK